MSSNAKMDLAGVRPIVVCGMPRSGTSYVASLLAAAGVFLGERILGPSPSNPRGHFEDLEFTDMHERMLIEQNAQMRERAMINDFALEARFEPEARALVARRMTRPMWGWKDTRNGLFLDFWRRLLPEARFVLVYRKPWEVVDSLVRRGDPDIAGNEAVAALAWTEYCERLLRLRAEMPERTLLGDVRGIAADEPGFLTMARDRLGYPLVVPRRAFFEPALLRSTDLPLAEPAGADVYGEAAAVYEQLESLADFPSRR